MDLGTGLLRVLIVVMIYIATGVEAGQTCASCLGADAGYDCQHVVRCLDEEVCNVIVYADELGRVLYDYGCAFPQACHNSVGSGFVGRSSDTTHHTICNSCCNDTSLCNRNRPCDNSGTTPASLPMECSEIPVSTRITGVHTIYPYGTVQVPVSVFCEFDSAGHGWTVIQRRYNGSVDFYRNWQAYKEGFGSPYGEYWLGNDVIHQLTSSNNHDLRIVMTDFDGVTKCAEYSIFHVGDESSDYKLLVFNYTGNAGDSLMPHNGQRFSTFDRDNDAYAAKSCSRAFHGAWWYVDCHSSNLNGEYLAGHTTSYADGVVWSAWLDILPRTQMVSSGAQ